MTTFTWAPPIFGGSTDLGISANWSFIAVARNQIPTSLDTLFFNATAGGTLTGTATALNANFFGTNPWTLSGANLTVGGLVTVNAGAKLSGNGTVTGTITDNGTITASGGLLTLSGPVGGTGLLQIGAGATLDVNSTSAGETISFLGSTGTLIDHQAGTIGAAISGFGASDTIDLSSLAFAAGATATIAGGVLTVRSGAGSETLSLTGIGNGTTFSVTADASGGTDIAILNAVAPPPPVNTVPTTFTWAPSPFGGTNLLSTAANWSSVTPNVIPTAIDTLNFNSGALATTLTGTATALNANFSGINPWILSGAQFTLGGLLTVSAGATLSGSGTVTGTITDNGTIKATGGLLTLAGPVGGTGLLGIGLGATLDVSTTGAGDTISFLGSTGTLVDHQVGTIGAVISGFGAGDTIDLSSLAFAAGATASIAGGVMTVKSGAAIETLRLTGIGNGSSFSVTQDASGTGTAIGVVTSVVGGLLVGGPGNDTLTGTAGNDTLLGAGGNDTLFGLAGNDVLNGGVGIDTMVGGIGNDTYLVDNALDVVTENLGEGTDTVFASVNYALAAGTEVEALRANSAAGLTLTGNEFSHLIVGGAGNDTLNGGIGNDTLNGGAGADTMAGGAGNDTYLGGVGADIMAGGAGNDTYLVDNALDVVTETLAGGTDTVFASVDYTLAAGTEVEALRVNSAAGLTLTGNEFSHTIVGGVGSDTLNGGAGNDTLNGGAGADTMAGGLGNDTYLVDNALDVVTETAGGGTDTVFASVNYSLSAGTQIEFLRANSAAGLTLTGNAFSHGIVGGAGNDTLIGGIGNDTLIGGAGNDVLDGGAGNNALAGGLGSDVFRFLPGFGHDVITDFTSNPVAGVDLLDISGLGITAATFAASVKIAASGATGANTLITIGASSIQLNAVTPATVNSSNFLLAP